MTMTPLSYIIPSYNNLPLLKRCLTSIEPQLEEGDQVIVVVDGSVDGTQAYLRDTYKEQKAFRIVEQENAGSGTARNNGVAHCETDYIWFVDSDDYIEPHASGVIKQELEANQYDLLFFNYIKHGKIAERIDLGLALKNRHELLLTTHFPWNKVIKRSLFETVAFPTEKIRYQDHATIPKLLIHAEEVGFMPEVLYHYDFSHPDNISKNVSKSNDIYTACDYLVDYFNRHLKTKDELETILIKTFIFNKLYNQSTRNMKQIHSDFSRMKAYLNSHVPDWEESPLLKKEAVSEYCNSIQKLKQKIYIGNLFKRSTWITTIFIYLFTKYKTNVRDA